MLPLLLTTLLALPQSRPSSVPGVPDEVRAAARQLAAVGIEVDIGKLRVETPGADELHASLRAFNEKVFSPAWFDQLWVTLGAAGLAVEATPEKFRANYFRGVQRAQVAWYVATEQRLVLNADAPPGADPELLLIHELTHVAQDRREGFAKIFARLGPTTDGLLLARCLTEGEAEAAALAVRLRRTGAELANCPPPRLAVTAEEEADGAMRLHYALGRAFVAERFRAGGWEAVRAAFAAPPRSTAELLRPEKARAAPPPALVAPPWPAGAGAAALVREDTWGELGLRMLLKLAGASGAEARVAALGWRGDRMRLWKTASGTHAFAWRIAFDREPDAEQCLALLKKRGRGKLARRGAALDWAYSEGGAHSAALAAVLEGVPLPAAASAAEASATEAFEAELAEAGPRVEAGRWWLPALGCSLAIPEGFSAREMNGVPVLLAPLADDDQAQAFRDNVVATSSALPGGGTLDEVLAAVRKTLAGPGCELIAGKRGEAAGREVLWLEYRTKHQVGTLHHLEIQWLGGPGKLSLTVTALDRRWHGIGTVMKGVLEGVRWR